VKLDYSAIIWDWNGTLINDAQLCCDIVSQIITSYGCAPATIDRYRKAYQHPIKGMYEALGLSVSDQEFQELSHRFLTVYEKERKMCSLHQGSAQILQNLKQNGVNQTLLSAHPHSLLVPTLMEYQIDNLFSSISGLIDSSGGSKINNGKQLVEALRLQGHSILLVGDSLHDFEVANETGIDCHLIAHGADCPDKLKATKQPIFASLVDWANTFEVY